MKNKNTIKILKAGFFVLVLILLFGIQGVKSGNNHPYNFGVVEEGKIYRSAQPDEEFLKYLIKEYKIKSILSLRGKEKLKEKFIKENHLNIFIFNLSYKKKPSEKQVKKILVIIENPLNQPILVHCAAGADRTGLIIAVLRIEKYGWTLYEVKKEMRYYRHHP